MFYYYFQEPFGSDGRGKERARSKNEEHGKRDGKGNKNDASFNLLRRKL